MLEMSFSHSAAISNFQNEIFSMFDIKKSIKKDKLVIFPLSDVLIFSKQIKIYTIKNSFINTNKVFFFFFFIKQTYKYIIFQKTQIKLFFE